MYEIITAVEKWRRQNLPIAVATVIETWGSAPRGVGARMAVNSEGEISGSVSGGCVEGAVVEQSLQVLATGHPQVLHFGVADETAWDVGLACGGTIEVFVQPLDLEIYDRVRQALTRGQSVGRMTLIAGPQNVLGREMLMFDDGTSYGSLGPDVEAVARQEGVALLASGEARRFRPAAGGVNLQDRGSSAEVSPELEVFTEVMAPPPTLIMVGGVHIAMALATIARALGYRTVVVDPRRAFGNQARFAQVDRLIQAWPQEALAEVPLTSSTAVAMLTHDPKIDDQALEIALPSPAFYVGALGSRKTQARRRQRLREAGLSETQLRRLRGPIGLDLGGRTPEEIALAIMAEIVAARNGRLQPET